MEPLAPLVILGLLFLVGALYALFAKRLRNSQIKTLNSPWYIPMVRAGGVFMMLIAVIAGLIFAANHGIDFVWPNFKL